MFNKTAILFVDAPVGCKFVKAGKRTVYTKVSPYHVRRTGRVRSVRVATTMMVQVETPDWAK